MVTLMTMWTWGSQGRRRHPPGYREKWADDVSGGASLDARNSSRAHLGLDSDPRSDLCTIPLPTVVSEAASLTVWGRGEPSPGVGVTGRVPPLAA